MRRDGVGGFGVAQGVEENVQRSPGGDAGIQQPQRAGGGVARVGEGRQPVRLELPVEAREGAPRHVDLAANFQAAQCASSPCQAQGNAPDGAQVLRDVLAHPAVAARRAAHEFPVFVEQRHAQAVDFRLDHVAEGLRRLVLQPHQARLELTQFIGIAGVVQAEHRHLMGHRFEPLGRLGANALGW